MKKLFVFSVMLFAVLFVSCSDEYDDSALTNRVDNLESRVERLEELCAQMNTNISSLQTLVNALQQKDFITTVAPINKDGKEVGYSITFSSGKSITIYHGSDGKDGSDGADGKDGTDGHTPIIGVKQASDGVYYWTVDGEWLLDADGNKIKAQSADSENGEDGEDGADGADGADGKDGKDGITPQLKIEDDYWYVSYDEGKTWTRLGKASGEDGSDGTSGDSIFQSVTQDDEYVYFKLSNGTTITIPKESALNITFNTSEYILVGEGCSYEISYTLTGADTETQVSAMAQDGYSAKVIPTNYQSGKIVITAPSSNVKSSQILVFVSKDSQIIMRTLHLLNETLILNETLTIADTDRYVSAVKNNYEIPIEVSVDGALGQDTPIEFIYDESLIAAYNAKKGKTYKAFDASRITCTPATLKGDATKVTATMTINMKDIPFEGDEYVLPFRLDKSKLMEGTQMASDDVVYVRLKRTLYGAWGNIQPGNANNYTQQLNSVDDAKYPWTYSNYMVGITRSTQEYQPGMYYAYGGPYPYMNDYYVWGRGYQWRVNWDEHFNGDPNKLVVKAWCCVTSSHEFSQEEQVQNSLDNDHGCYLDLEEGLVYFDFHFYWNAEEKYKDIRWIIKCYLAGGLTPEEF